MTGPAAVRELFRSRFGGTADGVWFAPGRANLMGEHTDYNEGFVLPFALGQGIVAAAARRRDRRLVLCSAQEPGSAVEVSLDGLEPGQVSGWAAYPAGVAWALADAGYEVPGACVAFDSDVPAGAGLSSSAALECATALVLTGEAGLARPAGDRRELAAIARRAENDFVGVPTGIMDQSAVLLGQAGHALLLDCCSGESDSVPLDPAAAGLALLIIDTRARHRLTESGYAARHIECEEAARALGVPSLRDIQDPSGLAGLADPVLHRRARHVVTENQRVLAMAALLRHGQVAGTGRLLNESHASLRDDFEISWPEADVTVDTALGAGALGARMMGGGFGGSVIALVPADSAAVRDALRSAFAGRGWPEPGFLDAPPSASAQRLW